ncbi:MAG: hypothetical protein ACRD2W_16915, partial [Acidimicrobiales bacterium]
MSAPRADLPRNATAKALTFTDVVSVGRSDPSKLVASFPAMATNLSRVAAERGDGATPGDVTRFRG